MRPRPKKWISGWLTSHARTVQSKALKAKVSGSPVGGGRVCAVEPSFIYGSHKAQKERMVQSVGGRKWGPGVQGRSHE